MEQEMRSEEPSGAIVIVALAVCTLVAFVLGVVVGFSAGVVLR